MAGFIDQFHGSLLLGAICLNKISDKAFADGCYHAFCRTCLNEWSKVKPECPVCRQAFRKIIHNVRSMADYDEIEVPRPQYPPHGFHDLYHREMDLLRNELGLFSTTNSSFPSYESLLEQMDSSLVMPQRRNYATRSW